MLWFFKKNVQKLTKNFAFHTKKFKNPFQKKISSFAHAPSKTNRPFPKKTSHFIHIIISFCVIKCNYYTHIYVTHTWYHFRYCIRQKGYLKAKRKQGKKEEESKEFMTLITDCAVLAKIFPVCAWSFKTYFCDIYVHRQRKREKKSHKLRWWNFCGHPKKNRTWVRVFVAVEQKKKNCTCNEINKQKDMT